MAKWNFPSLPDIGLQGFNTIGDQFKDKSVFHLAKEICQNSLDTMLSEYYENNGQPIRIEFKEFWMNTDEIPGNENGDLKKVFEDEYNFTNKFFKNDRSVVDFYDNALKTISDRKIRCLRISDFNTPGLVGSDAENDESSPWNNLTKNVGVSDKGSASGGSKGVGKFVSFVCSNLYTVFYSTIAKDGKKVSCGISRLSSYKNSNDEITLGEGYYDNNNYPLQNCISLDKNFERTSYGTDVYIVGFKNFSDWEVIMTAAVIDSFFSAILKGNLSVSIGELFELNKDTIDNCINDPRVKKLLDENTLAYYRIIKSDDVIRVTHSMFEENDLELLFKKDDEDYGSINKVAAVRYTGMKILDLSRLPRLGNYHGVLFLNGIDINAYFRKLENATHSNWSYDREIENPEEARARIDELKNFVKQSIEKEFTKALLEEIDATGIDEVLPDEEEFDGNDDGNNNEGIANDTVKEIKINEKVKRPPEKQSRVIDNNEETDEVVIDDDGNIVKNDPVPVSTPSGTGPNPSPFEDEEHTYSYVNRRMIPEKLRLISDDEIYKLLLKVKEDEPIIKLNFEIYGENSNEKFKPNQIYICDEQNNRKEVEIKNDEYIIKDLLSNHTYTVFITNNTDGDWPLEVKVYGVNK